MPEKVLKKLNTYILPQWKVCFFAAFFAGHLAYLYKITNWLPNWDSLVFRYDSQNMIALGRWFLPVVCSFSSFYDLPFLNGILAIIFHALGCVCIFRILGVKKKITAVLVGALISTFPTVTSVMMYNYVADGYAISFFLSTMAALYLTREKPKFILSAVLIALSMGIYQAYITVTIMLILFHLIDELVFKNVSFKVILKKALKILLSGILGAAIYWIILKVLLSSFSLELLDYQGMGDTASLSNIDLLGSLYVIKETFIKCFFDLSGGVSIYVILNAVLFVFTLFYYISHVVKIGIYREPARLVMIIVLGFMLILGSGALAFINPCVDYHNLMLMGYSVFYLFFIVIYERGCEKNPSIKCWTILVLSLAVISNQIVVANVSYHKAQLAYEKSYGVLIRIIDRIEKLPENEECNKILVVGALDDSDKYSVNLPPDITGITDGYIIRADDETVSQSVLTSAISDYSGKIYEFINGEEKKELLNREDVKSMAKWPGENSLKIIDDIIVIKLGNEGEF